METKTIQIRVSAEVAEQFETASEEERAKMEALISLQLKSFARPTRLLERIMDFISSDSQL
jgi:hypothetical protein